MLSRWATVNFLVSINIQTKGKKTLEESTTVNEPRQQPGGLFFHNVELTENYKSRRSRVLLTLDANLKAYSRERWRRSWLAFGTGWRCPGTKSSSFEEAPIVRPSDHWRRWPSSCWREVELLGAAAAAAAKSFSSGATASSGVRSPDEAAIGSSSNTNAAVGFGAPGERVGYAGIPMPGRVSV